MPKSLWGNPKVNSGGGLWYPPSFDGKGSSTSAPATPARCPAPPSTPGARADPGANLYADSMVKLDAKTGKMDWYYQQTPHNIYDWDFQDSPVLLSAGGKELAIGAGKSGVVVALDAKTGKPVWKTPVGKHNGHDNDGLYAMRGEYSKIKTGEVFPGALGGVIAPMASDGKTLFVPIVNHSMTLVSCSEISEESAATGEMVALDVATGKVKWKTELPSPAYGAPTVVNDVVFATTSEGVVSRASTTRAAAKSGRRACRPGPTPGSMVNGEYLSPGGPAGGRRAGSPDRRLQARRLGGGAVPCCRRGRAAPPPYGCPYLETDRRSVLLEREC